jgi:hypothetical protein
MPVIIRVIAPTFSERNRASWGGAERNAAEQIVLMYSAKEGARGRVRRQRGCRCDEARSHRPQTQAES